MGRNNMYDQIYKDKKYIDIVLKQLEEASEDIGMISVYNDDFLHEEASELSKRVIEIRKLLEERFK